MDPQAPLSPSLKRRSLRLDEKDLDEVATIWENAVAIPAFIKNNKRNWFDLRRELEIQKLTEDTLKKYGVKATVALDGFVLPRFILPGAETNPTGLKVVSLDRSANSLVAENFPDNGKFSGLFGWHLATPMDNDVVLTADEFDAMAVHQGTRKLALALPPGSFTFASEVLPYLDTFERIYMWFPDDSVKEAKQIAQDLRPTRSFVVTGNASESVPRPLKTLDRFGSRRMREILGDMVDEDPGVVEGANAGPLVRRVSTNNFQYTQPTGQSSVLQPMVQPVLPKNALLTPQNLRPAVRDEIVNARKHTKGFAVWKRFEPLNRYVGGFRPGELTVLTGPSGVGKTTFLCDYSVDLWMQGVRTLYCSFEVAPVRIFKTMLHQFSGRPLWRYENHPEVDRWVDRFMSTNIMLFLRTEHFEGLSPEQILKSIRTQSTAGGINHVIIDNLQFMLGGAEGKDGDLQDHLVGQFRKMSNDTGAHITIVVHPKKEVAGVPLSLDSISGRIVQDSDTVYIMQRLQRTAGAKKHLFIVKNRFGGEKVEDERLELRFNKDTFSHTLFDKSRVGPVKSAD